VARSRNPEYAPAETDGTTEEEAPVMADRFIVLASGANVAPIAETHLQEIDTWIGRARFAAIAETRASAEWAEARRAERQAKEAYDTAVCAGRMLRGDLCRVLGFPA
jgi:hypothetical protein